MREGLIKNKLYNSDRIVLAKHNGAILVSDSRFIVRLPEMSPVFESRIKFPAMPVEGEDLVFPQGKVPSTPMGDLWDSTIEKCQSELTVTSWMCKSSPFSDVFASVLLFEDGRRLFANIDYLNILGDWTQDYFHFKGDCTGPRFEHPPFVAYIEDDPVAVIMPMYLENNLQDLPPKPQTQE